MAKKRKPKKTKKAHRKKPRRLGAHYFPASAGMPTHKPGQGGYLMQG